MDKFLWSLTFIIVGVLALCIYALVEENESCEDRGGEMVGTGEYTTTFITSGKVLVPIQSEVNACTVAE